MRVSISGKLRLGLSLLAAAAVAAGAWAYRLEPVQIWMAESRSTAGLESEVRARPDAPWPAYVLATRYLESGRVSEGLDLLQRIRTLAPDSYRPHYATGLGLMRLGAAPAAIQPLQEAVRLAPQEPRIQVQLGTVLRLAGRYGEAIRVLERVTARAPRSAEAFYQLGLAYYRPNAKEGEGRRCFQRAVELQPRNGLYQKEQARGLADVGDYQRAEEHARQAVALVSRDPWAHTILGKVLHRTGRLPEAERELQEALKLRPETVEAQYELGLLLSERGEHAAAAHHFSAATRLSPAFEPAWLHLAEAADRAAQPEIAARARRRFQALAADRDERQFLERRLFDTPSDLDLRRRYAALLERAGDLPAAGGQYLLILNDHPNDPRARRELERLDRIVRARPGAPIRSPQP